MFCLSFGHGDLVCAAVVRKSLGEDSSNTDGNSADQQP